MSKKALGENVRNLLTLRKVRNPYATIVQSFFNEMSINLYMFGSITLNMVINNANRSHIIVE